MSMEMGVLMSSILEGESFTWRLDDLAKAKAASNEFIRGSVNSLAPAHVKKNTARPHEIEWKSLQ